MISEVTWLVSELEEGAEKDLLEKTPRSTKGRLDE